MLVIPLLLCHQFSKVKAKAGPTSSKSRMSMDLTESSQQTVILIYHQCQSIIFIISQMAVKIKIVKTMLMLQTMIMIYDEDHGYKIKIKTNNDEDDLSITIHHLISSDSEDDGKQTNVGILHTINQLLPDLQMIQASPVAVSWIFCKVALSIYLQLDSSFPTPGWWSGIHKV